MVNALDGMLLISQIDIGWKHGNEQVRQSQAAITLTEAGISSNATQISEATNVYQLQRMLEVGPVLAY